jgi:hypothetical protein
MAIFDENFKGHYSDSTRRVEYLTCSFAQPLWDVYSLYFLAPKEATAALHWIQGYAQERESAGDIYCPVEPHFLRTPLKVIDSFRYGNWKAVDSVKELGDLSLHFSAYSILAWLPDSVSIQYRFPSFGVCFQDAINLLSNLIWLIAVPVVSRAGSLSDQMVIQHKTYILIALDALLKALQTVRSHYGNLQRLWDKDVESKHKCMFRLINDIDMIFSCFRLLIRPFEKPTIFYPAIHCSRPNSTEFVLWSFYTMHSCPRFLSPSDDPPHLAQAISTLSSQFANQWRAFLQRGYVDLDSPPEFLCALVAAPAPRKQKSEEASPQGSNKKQKSSDSSGKKKSAPLRGSTIPLLRWLPDTPADKRNTNGIKNIL